ncbi:centrosomal protein of 295 kDa [Perognathus longimembris pacificus]|uniref:centrosomal protein of 295 kDa n=1 Tax=Perognathus longimembris pacificus TaxID=214514 RepID=UPI0020190F60|nr:centrosomal protein of 295 kDa [Perognathus longimembris pacificus]
MAEVTRAGRWPPPRYSNGYWEAEWGELSDLVSCGLQTEDSRYSDLIYLKYTEMKRKVVNASKLRLSPNEEACILKEDYERRRKLRLLQVREQERDIALQIREDIKQRRNEQFTRLAEELRAQWEEAQSQKIQNLEKLYLASLREMGKGHRQAKENQPDLDAVARRAAERKKKAEVRHREALKLQKNQKEMSLKEKTWYINARKEALLVEKERSAKITSLPIPPPAPFENIEIKKISSVKTNSSTYHHMSTFVNRQMDASEPDARLAAEKEATRLEELQRQAAQERTEQFEKAYARGFQAMQKIHLAHNQENVMRELKQRQQEDLARRRQTVAQMPPQLVELPYRRSEMKEDWQRELEFAFEDMYNADRKVKGNLILHLEPEPLPTMSDQIQDEELDLSVEQKDMDELENLQMTDAAVVGPHETNVKTQQIPSKILFKKLLNKIRSQKSLWTIKSISEDECEMTTTVSESERKTAAVEAGAVDVIQSDVLTIESGPLSSEDKSLPCHTDTEKEQEVDETLPGTAVAQSSILLHPQEEAVRVRTSAKQKQIMEIEIQKQKQLELLAQIEQQKLRLETDCFRAQLEEDRRKRTLQPEVGTDSSSSTVISDEDDHRQMIRNYQQQLLHQNRLHRQSVETARKRLLEYQTILKEKYPSSATTSLVSDSVVSEHWHQSRGLNSCPYKSKPVQPIQSSRLEQGHIQSLRQSPIPQRQVEATEKLSASDVLAKKSLDSQDHIRQFSGTETQQTDYTLVPTEFHILSRALSSDRARIQNARELSETFRLTTFQTLDSQQMSQDNENISSKLTESSSFLPLVPEHSFTLLPVNAESGKIQEPLPTTSKSAVCISHSVDSQMHDQPLTSSETITAHQGNLKALQEQLELQKDILQARQETQEQMLLHKQKELEEQIGFSVFLPSVAHSFASLTSATAKSGRTQESSVAKNATSTSSSDPVIPQLQDRLSSVSQPTLSQLNSLKFPPEQLNIHKDSLQARREAQEVLFVHKQCDLDGGLCSGQPGPSFQPHQVAQHTFTSCPFADTKSTIIQEQPLSNNEEGFLSSHSEMLVSQNGAWSFLPLHDSSRLLQEQLATQKDIPPIRCDAQVDALLHRQKDVRNTQLGHIGSSPVLVQHIDASPVSTDAQPRFQKHYLLKKESIIPSDDLTSPRFQDTSLSFPQQGVPKQEHFTTLQEQSHIQRVILGARKETQKFVYKQTELEKRISSEQSGTSLPGAESGRFQDLTSIKSDDTGPLIHSTIPRFQERLLRFSQHVLPQPDNLQKHQEYMDTPKEVSHFSQKNQDNTPSEQTGFSSFTPQLKQLSITSLRSPDSSITQEPISIASDSKISSSHFQIPQLQHKLLKLSRCIQPQQDNLKALQEKLATQREAIIQARQEAREEILLRNQRNWEERVSPEQVGISSSLRIAQHPCASLPPTGPERTQEPCPAHTESTTPSSHTEVLVLPDRLLGLSHTVLQQQDNLITLQEHLHVQTDSIPSEKTQKELVSRQRESETKGSSEHFIQPHHGDLKTLQHQLDIQRKAIRFGQEVQEELLLQRLSTLEKRVSSEQISSFASQVELPIAISEGTQKSFPADSGNMEFSALPLSSSQPVLPPQGDLKVCHEEDTQEELLLNKESQFSKIESAELALSSSFLSEELEHSFIPLPFAETKYTSTYELNSSKNEHEASSCDSEIPGFQERLLNYSQPILLQQNYMSAEKQFDLQREVVHYNQKASEEFLEHRQTLQKHSDHQESKAMTENYFKMQKMEQFREWIPHIQGLAGGDQESISHAAGEHLDKELCKRASKPPVAKVKCGLNLNQHELSAIQEIESPVSGRTSIPDKLVIFEDRDPMRVSISREQNFLQSPPAHDPFVCHQPSAQENIRSDGITDEAVKVKESDVENCAVLSYAVEEVCTHVTPVVQPDNKTEAQDPSHEPSSITVSTGSFLSYENTDLSLTDAESFSEPMDHQEQESTIKQEKTDILSSVVSSMQMIYQQQQNSSDVPNSLLPVMEEFTSGHTESQQNTDSCRKEVNLIPEKTDLWVDLDFPELEFVFPNLHHQLFQPLKPQANFDLSSSSSSGISQDNREFYQTLDSSERYHATVTSRSTVSFTALRQTHLNSFLNTRLNQQPDPNLTHIATPTFAAGNTEGSEEPFQKLLPEISSQEGSQHADLPTIVSIEARDSSQGMENEKSPCEQAEILQNKKSVHFHRCVGDSSSACSSSDFSVFDQLRVQHSTPCGSTSSECSIKLESEEGRLDFQELSKRQMVTILQSQELKDDKRTTCRSPINPHVEDSDSQLRVRTVEMGTSVQTPEEYFEKSCKIETPEALSLSQPALSEPHRSLRSFSFQSSIPVWETESGHGIMEEPDLTLVSSSDISIAETDFANLTIEERNESNSVQVNEFLPFISATEASDYTPTVSTAMPETLQAAFMQEKESFMARSYQRQKELSSKTQISENSLIGTDSAGHHKDVNDVRVCLPEDRQNEQAIMPRRVKRLCNQLAEVKQQKEEKAKQEVYAQNRAKAKEFHKKTLEKLRAKNTC